MKKMINIRVAAVLATLVFLLSGCSSGGNAVATEYPTLDSAGLDSLLEKSKGKPVVVCFWTTWCPACREELPELSESAREYAGKVVYAAVSLDEKSSAVERFFSDKNPGLPVYIGSNDLAARFQISAIPHMVIFDKKGEVLFSRPGLFPKDMLGKMLDKALEQ